MEGGPEKIPDGVSRETAMKAYREFIDQGVTNPDALDLDDPALQEANKLFFAWIEQEDAKGKVV